MSKRNAILYEPYKGINRKTKDVGVAQSVEHSTHKAKVAGSIPAVDTKIQEDFCGDGESKPLCFRQGSKSGVVSLCDRRAREESS